MGVIGLVEFAVKKNNWDEEDGCMDVLATGLMPGIRCSESEEGLDGERKK